MKYFSIAAARACFASNLVRRMLRRPGDSDVRPQPMVSCYMCSANAVTKEHVPPDSFFPPGYRAQLWTVPSCDAHNHDNSKDVEYVRNIIATHLQTEGSAGAHLQDKILRSFTRNDKLFNQTFADATPIMIDGRETAVYSIETPRFMKIMNAIAYGVYYKTRGESYLGTWGIFSPTLISRKAFYVGIPDNWEKCLQLVQGVTYIDVPTPHSQIFRLGFCQFAQDQIIFEFVFFEGFHVLCFGS